MTATLNHSTLGKLRGITSPATKTTQYRNLKYASIPGRWEDPVLINSLEKKNYEEVFDATKHGPSCPQHPGGFKFDLSLIGEGLGLKLDEEAEVMDEWQCLNLVVTVPEGVRQGLPVMVFVHGGGFSVGASSWPQYDLARLVASSAEIGKPVIGVSINYRLGPFGWLASSELGIDGNYALKDQACAFRWIQKHISTFGGNPKNITAFGESAGSICVAHHLLLATHQSPLFHHAILMSGDSTLRRARSISWQDKHYLTTISSLGLETHTPKERKELLKSLNDKQLVGKLPMFMHWSPCVDGFLIKEDVGLGSVGDRNRWGGRVLMGDCLDDGTILTARIILNPSILPLLQTSLATSLTLNQSQDLLTAYNLHSPLQPEQQFNALLRLAGDLRFYFPILMYEKSFLGKAKDFKRYHFHAPNPMEGGTKGRACHELDLYCLLGNVENLREKDNGLGKEMVREFVGWVYGEERDGDVLIFGGDKDGNRGDGVRRVGSEVYDREYRGGRGEMLKKFGWENVFRLGELLQGCRGEEEQTPITYQQRTKL